MSEEQNREELERLVEAQARREEPAEVEAPTEQPPQERKLDRRKSKGHAMVQGGWT